MRHRLLAGASFVALLAAGCIQDAAGPNKDSNDPKRASPFATAQIGEPSLAVQIEAELTCLYTEGLLPNYASSIGKLKDIKAKLAAGDVQGALEATANLVRFIELKYSQYTGGPISCDPPVPGYPNPDPPYPDPVSVEVLKDAVIEHLWAYVGLTGEICEVPVGQPRLCRTAEQSGFVYFPDNIFTQLTFVGIEANPPGLTALQGLFDEYPNRIRIVTSGLSDFSSFTLKPLVVVCFNDGDYSLPNFTSIAARLLLGSKHDLLDFAFLPPALFGDYPEAIRQEAIAMCGPPPQPPPPFPSTTAFGRLGNRLLDLLLPEALQAARIEELAFGGVGGSAEQFSDFGVVDPGLSAFGGVGGSAEQFSRQSSRAPVIGSANLHVSPSGTVVTGTADEGDVTDPDHLPKVRVVTPVGLTGIDGVIVTFELLAPVTPLYAGHPSDATLCSPTAPVETTGGGYASVPCINFGTVPGYMNLRATFDPSGVDPLACIINAAGACATAATSVNFLVETVPGAPAKLAVIGSPGSTSAQVGVAMNPQPVLEVQDASSNPVTLTGDITISSVTVVNQDGTSCGSGCALSSFTTTTNQSTGRVTFSGLALSGVVGTTYKLTFNSGSLTPATALVAVTAPGAPAVIEAFLPSGGTYSGTFGAFSPVTPDPTVRVRDGYANNVAGANVAWLRTDALVGGGLSAASTTTGATGQSSVIWTLGEGANTLSASLSGFPGVTAATFAATGAKFDIAACGPSGNQKKTDLARYSSSPSILGYLGNLSMVAAASGSIRSAEVAISVTGQSSGTGGYVTDARFYLASGTGKGALIASGKPFNASNPTDQTLRIPGDNGSPALIRFNLTPVAGAVLSVGEKVIFELQITAASNRTFQVWYNTKTDVGTPCHESKVYGAGVTNFTTGAATRGVNMKIRNYPY